MKLLISLSLILCSVQLYAQFTLSGEFRPRTEYSHGYKSLAAPGQNPSAFTSQRSRLNLDFASEAVKTKLVLQDVRVWGSQPQLVGNEEMAVSVHEAWAEFQLVKDLSLKAGRMELVYDDHRIFGSVGWAQQARSHDLALLKYSGKINIHLGAAYNENTVRTNNIYNGADAYKSMQFLWVNHKSETNTLSLLVLNNGTPHAEAVDTLGNTTNESTKFSQTMGIYNALKINKLKIAASAYYQTGIDNNNHVVDALQASLSAGYQVNDNISTGLGGEYLSGTDYNTTLRNNSFTPFYGTNHKFNGFMDYFYVGNHINSVGLIDLNVNLGYKKGKFSSTVFAHYFESAAEIAPGVDNYLGSEIDIVAGYKLSDVVNINAGYSHMIPTTSMEALKGGDLDQNNNWAWLMITVKPTFFTTK